MNTPYRILSLDGGGSWALVQVRCLQELFKDRPSIRGHELLAEFDLVAANSGGSLTLAGLLMNLSLDELLDLYLDERNRRKIFVPNSLFWRKFYRTIGIGPRYHTPEKIQGIRSVLGETGSKTLQQLHKGLQIPPNGRRPHLMICGFDYSARRGAFFRSNDNSRAQSHELAKMMRRSDVPVQFEEVTLAEAVHASTNAPVNFFNRPARIQVTCDGETKQRLFWDGAVGGYNNPVLAAVTESICNGVPANQIYILSLGTGGEFLPAPGKRPTESPELLRSKPDLSNRSRRLIGFREDLQKLATSILSDPPDAASFVTYTILFRDELALGRLQDTNPRFIRLNPLIQPVLDSSRKRWNLPQGIDAERFKYLKKLQLDAIEKSAVDAIHEFANAWLLDHVPNQPIRWDQDLQAILGYGRFSAGESAWRTWP